MELDYHLQSEQSDALIQTIPDAIFKMSRKGIISMVREPKNFRLHIDAPNSVGRAAHEVLPGHVADKYLYWVNKALDDRQLQIYEYPIEVDGQLFHREARIVPFSSDEIIGIVRDITDRKAVERQLELRVAERTKELELANKELESFVFFISHELRAPMRTLSNSIRKLLQNFNIEPGTPLFESLNLIDEVTKKIKNIVEELLSFSLRARETRAKTKVDLYQVVKEAVSALSEETKAREIEWILEPLPAIDGDSSLFRVVFDNLLSNALKFSRPQRKTVIHIGHFQNDAEVVFFVKDNGAGFKKEFSHKLFVLFQRLHTSDEFEGTGIGLASVRRIISQHGGRTWAEGEEGKGATIYFSLPLSS